jgi:predicted dehydrogenase
VLVEKPLRNNAEDAAQMLAAAQASGGIIIEAIPLPLPSLVRRALTTLRGGAIGASAHRAVFNAICPIRPGELRYIEELGGGALMDLGCYCLHWIRTVAGDEPTS